MYEQFLSNLRHCKIGTESKAWLANTKLFYQDGFFYSICSFFVVSEFTIPRAYELTQPNKTNVGTRTEEATNMETVVLIFMRT